MNGKNKSEMGKTTRAKIIKLIRKVNISKRRVGKGLLPLTYEDDGWRIILPRALDFYDFLPSGRRLMEMSVYDYDMEGEYYWIPYASPPKGVTTPSLRLMALGGEE